MTTSRQQAEAKLRECFPEPWNSWLDHVAGTWRASAMRSGVSLLAMDPSPLAAAEALIQAWKDATTPKEVMPNAPARLDNGGDVGPGAAHPEHTPTVEHSRDSIHASADALLDEEHAMPAMPADISDHDRAGKMFAIWRHRWQEMGPGVMSRMEAAAELEAAFAEVRRQARDETSASYKVESEEGAEIVGELQRALAASQAEGRALREAMDHALPQTCDGSGYESTYREDERGIEHQVDEPCGGCCACLSPSAALRAVCEKVAREAWEQADGIVKDLPEHQQEEYGRRIVDSVLGPAQEG